MMTISPKASDHLLNVLVEREAGEELAIRMKSEPGGLFLTEDVPREDDVVFEHRGRLVLLLQRDLAEVLENRVLDLEQRPEGPTLRLYT